MHTNLTIYIFESSTHIKFFFSSIISHYVLIMQSRRKRTQRLYLAIQQLSDHIRSLCNDVYFPITSTYIMHATTKFCPLYTLNDRFNCVLYFILRIILNRRSKCLFTLYYCYTNIFLV